MAASDKLAAAELTIAKEQLKSLHGTVMRINQERAEVSAEGCQDVLGSTVSQQSSTQYRSLVQTSVTLSAFLFPVCLLCFLLFFKTALLCVALAVLILTL